jgi:porphobilinogen synthase
VGAFPVTRLRRLRRTGAIRTLVRETRLDLDDFVMPLFVGPRSEQNEALPAMGRWSVDDVAEEVDRLVVAGVGAVILFGIPAEKDEEGSGAWDDDGVIQRALRELRTRFPELALLTDVCLCEYTDHGHCGVIVDDQVDNDATLDLLARTAVSHVDAGADVVCPSDMMDGRVAAIREALPRRRSSPIQPSTPRRSTAVHDRRLGAVLRRPPRLPDGPANIREALRECGSRRRART